MNKRSDPMMQAAIRSFLAGASHHSLYPACFHQDATRVSYENWPEEPTEEFRLDYLYRRLFVMRERN